MKKTVLKHFIQQCHLRFFFFFKDSMLDANIRIFVQLFIYQKLQLCTEHEGFQFLLAFHEEIFC